MIKSIVFTLAASQLPQNGVSFKVETLLSIVAIVISICSIVFQCSSSKKINRTNLDADFFKDIYGNYLMKIIPEARNVIHYNNGEITGTDDLINALNDMRRASLFFKYKDKSFYSVLCQKLQKLEDELVKKTGYIADDDYAEFIMEINNQLEKIYEIITNKYVGKKIKE